jgi:branched-chain amino acid transport system substrate-binding protein
MRGAGARVASAALGLAVLMGLPAEAQPPIRIGASASQTGTYAALGQNQLRGYQLCVKHVDDKGGILGRKLELLVEDDRSQPATAIRIYERLIARDRVDLVFSPYGTPLTEPVADVTEKHGMPLVSPIAAASSMYKKGRRFLFMLPSPGEVYLEGLLDLAARHGLKTVALIYEDTLFPRTAVTGATDLARRNGLQVLFTEAYPKGTTDFSAILTRVRAVNPDVLGAATFFDDAVAISRQMKDVDVNPRMYGVTVGGALPRFYELLGRRAEFVYSASPWEPELVTLRAGGLIPIARQYPGAREFVEAHGKEFPGADLSYHTAAGYASCQILMEAIRRTGSLDKEKIRSAILNMDLNTVYGAFRVDRDGFQIAHKTVTIQW